MTFPVFRTDPERSRRITWWSCGLGYLITLAGVPMVAGAVMALAVAMLGGSGITHTPIGPALQYAERTVQYLMYSIGAAYIGAILSVPVVIWARLLGWFGWATAALTGIAVGWLVIEAPSGNLSMAFLLKLGPPCAILGLAFWLTVRLIHPSAFGVDP